VIAIDLGRGSYYSLSGAAADVWSMLQTGASAEELAAAFDGGADSAEVDREVRALLERLQAETLILPDEVEGAAEPNATARFTYRPSVFEKYDDLQDYFMLDPIHEVDPAGWPRAQGV
jgi:hypothetical protein